MRWHAWHLAERESKEVQLRYKALGSCWVVSMFNTIAAYSLYETDSCKN